MGYILGVDIGTQGIKGVFVNEKLKVVAKTYAEHTFSQVKPGWAEHNAEEIWWKGFKHIVQKLLMKVSFSPEEIIAIGCSGISPCMLPIDKQNRPLRNAILYGIDTRSKDEVKEMTQKLGEKRLLKIARQPLSTQFVGPKILWFKKNESQKFKQTRKIFTTTNYIVYKLTGNFFLDYTQASQFSPFYNYDKMNWDEEVCDIFNVPLDIFPRLKNSYDVAGTVTKKAADETGLAKNTPVIVGTADGWAEIVSAGGFNKGEVALIYGTTGIISVTTDKIPIIKEIWILPHPVLDKYYLAAGGTATTGALTKWFRNNFGDIERIMQERIKVNAYGLLSKEAVSIPPGSDGLLVLPYFSGERTPINDPLARGVIMGLTTYHSRAHLYRALLEGAAYSFRHHFDIFKSYGFEISKVIACGGGTKSNLWVQIVSDIIGYDQFLPQVPVGAEIGTTYLAAEAIGVINDFQFLVKTIRKDARRVTVNRRNRKIYQEYYKIYRNLYNNIKYDMHTLAIKAEIDFPESFEELKK